jgi:hypothetical protein
LYYNFLAVDARGTPLYYTTLVNLTAANNDAPFMGYRAEFYENPEKNVSVTVPRVISQYALII